MKYSPQRSSFLNILAIGLYLAFMSACGCSRNKLKNKELIINQGAELYAKYACISCHALDGNVVYGPPLNDIYMKEIKVLRNGEEINLVVNREYLRKAIAEPRFEKVLDYKNKDMPLTFISEDEIDILVEYIIAFSEKAPQGKKRNK